MSRSRAPRIRTIKPEHWQDERLAWLSLGAHTLYVGLITQADDEGRESSHLALLKARIFPFHAAAESDLPGWLQELATAGLIELYAAGDRSLLQITSWANDQRVDKPTPSELPAPPQRNPEDSRALAINREESRAFLPSRAPADRTGPDQDRDQEPATPDGAGTRTEDVRAVFDAWVTATERDQHRTKLTPDRRRLIEKRLRSHGLDDCMDAVRNIGASTEARAGYGRGQRYDDLTHALGKTEQIERWREAADRGLSATTTGDLAKYDLTARGA